MSLQSFFEERDRRKAQPIAPFTYALTGAHICIPGENPAEFESLLAGITAEMKPTGEATRFLVEEMAQCQWKLRRSTVILRDHFHFLLHLADYNTIANAYHHDNTGVHTITKLARYENLLRRAWRECYQLLLKNRERSSAEPRVQQAGSSNPPFPSETPARQNSTHFDTPSLSSDLPAIPDTPPTSSGLHSPGCDLPSSNPTEIDTQEHSLQPANADPVSPTPRSRSSQPDTPSPEPGSASR